MKVQRKKRRALPRATLHLQDEIPYIGSGIRIVLVDQVGRKWVWLRTTYRPRRVRVAREVFERLEYRPKATSASTAA